jgi:alkanesulfonate monooxygenase SsuD/methylene tetrahydromethanopterin reductase-like flavin-dependent oxidoreductase (luciferase family)
MHRILKNTIVINLIHLIGDKDRIRNQLNAFQKQFHADEIMAASYIYDFAKQKNSFKLLTEAADER